MGYTSPYPTVASVTIPHHIACGISGNLSGWASCSAVYIRLDEKTRTMSRIKRARRISSFLLTITFWNVFAASEYRPDLEDPHETHEPQGPQHPEVDRDEHRQVERHDGEQVYDSHRCEREPHAAGHGCLEFRIESTGPEPEYVFDGKDQHGHYIDCYKDRVVRIGKALHGFKDHRRYVGDNEQAHEEVEARGPHARMRTLLDDIEDPASSPIQQMQKRTVFLQANRVISREIFAVSIR